MIPFKKQKTQWTVLSIALIAVSASRVSWIQDDLGYLLTIDDRPVDVIGNISAEGIWSGYTNPHKSALFIRDYLSHQVSALPVQLIHCFDPQFKSFN